MATAVRLACDADLGAIVAISNRAAADTAANFAIEPEPLEDWRTAFEKTREGMPWFVAELAGSHDRNRIVAGFCRATPWRGRCAYSHSVETTVYVAPEHHGQGIGRALYERLIDTLRAQGYRSAIGGITQPNPASVQLHESFGFTRVAMFQRIGWKFGSWHDVGYWQLDLAPDARAPNSIRLVRDVVE